MRGEGPIVIRKIRKGFIGSFQEGHLITDVWGLRAKWSLVER